LGTRRDRRRLIRGASAQRRRIGAIATLAVAIFSISSARAGPPYVTDDPEPVEYQHWELYSYSTGTLAGGGSNGGSPAIEFNYGFAENSRIAIVAPMAFNRTPGEFAWGYGDTEISLKHRLVEQDKEGWRPSIGVVPTVELPSGDFRRGLGAGSVRWFLPIWAQKDWGDWELYGGGGLWLDPGPQGRNAWFSGAVLQRKLDDRLTVGAEIYHQSAYEVGARDQTGFNFGAVFDFDEHRHFLLSVGRGVQNVRDTNQFSWFAGILLTGGDEKGVTKSKLPDADWNGFYIGAAAGISPVRSEERLSLTGAPPLSTAHSATDALGGAFAGYNQQIGSLLLGTELDVEYAGELSARGSTPFGVSPRVDAAGAARARLGFSFGRIAPYLAGGIALADYHGSTLAEDSTAARAGWTAGLGFDYRLSDQWSARLEWRRVDLAASTYFSNYIDNTSTRGRLSADMLSMGFAYSFPFQHGE